MDETTHTSDNLQPGDRIGKFDLLEQIGRGGMSIVWKGYDKLLDKKVAIKQIGGDVWDHGNDEQREHLRQRFRHEAKIQTNLTVDDKHLVKVLEFIEEQRGLFIVMEYVDGPSLEQILATNNEPMDQRQAIGIIAAIGKALAAIHARGIIHRDLKPSNILLPRTGGLKVCDFGLASLLADQEALSLGSVRYMAPELFSGEPVDVRADIYSLGMIAYEMLAGRKAFEQAFRIVLRDQRNQAMRWMKWHTNQRAKCPPLYELDPAIPEGLSELVERLMEKSPNQRLESTKVLLKAIRRHITGKDEIDAAIASVEAQVRTAAAQAATADEQTKALPIPDRKRMMMIAVPAAVVGLLLIIGIWHWASTSAETRRLYDAAVQQYVRAGIDHDAGRYEQAKEVFDELAIAWQQDSQLGPKSAARALLAQAEIDLAAGRYDEARTALTLADQKRALPRDPILLRLREVNQQAAFAKVVEAVQEDLRQARYRQARGQLSRARSVTRTDAERQILNQLGEQLADQEKLFEIQSAMDRAKVLVEGDKRKEATALLIKTQKKYPDRQLVQLHDEIVRNGLFAEKVSEGRAAEARGELAVAIMTYNEALKIKQDTALGDEIRALEARAAAEEGYRRLQAGNAPGASASFTVALGKDPDNEMARAGLAEIATADQRKVFVDAGDNAIASGDYDTAVAQFENAWKLDSDPAVKAKLTDARVRQQLNICRRLLREGDTDKASAAYELAQIAAPNDPRVAEAASEVQNWIAYYQHLAAGDAYRQRSLFGDAKREYRRAREFVETPDVEQRLGDTEYDHLVAQAQNYIQTKQWKSAHSCLISAAQYRETEQLQELLAQVTANLP